MGFTKTSNIVLFFLTAGIFAVFCIVRLPSLNYEGVWGKRIAPGEWFWFRQGRYRVGMIIHLWSVLRKCPLCRYTLAKLFTDRLSSLVNVIV